MCPRSYCERRRNVMKKRLIQLLLTPAVVLFVNSAFAQDATSLDDLGPPIESAVTAFEELNLRSLTIDPIEIQSATTPGILAPAPPLTQLHILAVGSSNCGWEEIVSGATSTSCDHGGAQLRVEVLEIGYGSNRIAWMIGGQLPASANYETRLVCQQFGGGLDYCTPGQTAVGFQHSYNLDGHQGGTFTYQNTSTNSPWNTMSRSINIQ